MTGRQEVGLGAALKTSQHEENRRWGMTQTRERFSLTSPCATKALELLQRTTTQREITWEEMLGFWKYGQLYAVGKYRGQRLSHGSLRCVS